MEQIAAVQPLIIGCLFAWSGGWKVFSPRAGRLAMQSAVGKLLPIPWMTKTVYLALGLGELGVAGTLLAVPPARWWAIRVATVFAVGFLVYLGVAWRIAPERPCACMGGQARRVSRSSRLRASLVLLMALFGWFSQTYWAAAINAAPQLIFLAGAEGWLLWLVSPEFGNVGTRIGKQLAMRLVRSLRYLRDPSCAHMSTNWAGVERDLRSTAVFRQLVPQVSHRSDAWSEGCWRFITFGMEVEGRLATAVFSVPALFDADAISASLVDDVDGVVLTRIASRSGDGPPARVASVL